jgi:hypothetical protein
VTAHERPATIEDEIVGDLAPRSDRSVLLRGKLMAHLLRQRGLLPLHAGGVAIKRKGVRFLGESGAKSTTAAAFCARGHGIPADDAGAVHGARHGVALQPAWPGLRLLHDVRRAIGLSAAPSDFQNGKHIFSLEQYAAAPLRGGLPSVALLNSLSFLRTWHVGNELRRASPAGSASIASLLPVRRLVWPRSFDRLRELIDFAERDVAACD